jgi:hypothetical protein
LYSTATTQHQPVTSLENVKSYGQKAPPVEVPKEPKNDGNALVRSMLPQSKITTRSREQATSICIVLVWQNGVGQIIFLELHQFYLRPS